VQWLINEFKDFKRDVMLKLDAAVSEYVKKQIEDAERLTKLEGEIKAMKARMGKKPE
jgi:hypothetical protein